MFRKLAKNIPIFPEALKYIYKNAAAIAFIGGSAAILGKLVQVSKREQKIIGTQTGQECADFVKNSKNFHVTSIPKHGTMTSRRFVEEEETQKEYFAKGAHSADEFLAEFMVASFLKLVNPYQPESAILQEDLPNNKARYYTLSFKHPDSKDVENFVLSHGTDKLKQAKEKGLSVEGFGESLAADLLFGKYYDTKYANMIVVIGKDGSLYFATIDHERAVLSIVLPKSILTTRPESLLSIIRDISITEEADIGIINDPRAMEFANVIKTFIDPSKIIEFYKKTSSVDVSPIIDKCNRFASQSGIFSQTKCNDYEKHFKDIQSKAGKFAVEREKEIAASKNSITRSTR